MSAPDRFIVVAIDGGAASGKSSTARGLRERLGLLHADTGSHYRFLTHQLIRLGVGPQEGPVLERALAGLKLGVRIEGSAAQPELDGAVPGPEIRSPEVNAQVSAYAALPSLRRFLLLYQRGHAELARRAGFRGLVMEGRDIGSVIFPDADHRFFLTADPVARARRRAAEGQKDSVEARDLADRSRLTAPLACPPGATVIDSTHLTLDEVIERLAGIITGSTG